MTTRPRITDPRAVPVLGTDAHLAAVDVARLNADALRSRLNAPPAWAPEKLGDGGLFDGNERSNASVLVPLVAGAIAWAGIRRAPQVTRRTT